MSLLNVWILPHEAIVAVDTDGIGQDGARMPTSKLLPIPHINVVLGLRGQAAFLWFLYLRCLSSSFDTFDQMNDAMPDLLAFATASLPENLIAESPIGNELIAIGWSGRQGRMIGRLHYKRDAMTEFAAADIASSLVSPWDKSMPDIPKAPAALEKIAKAQVRWMRETFPGAACGGKLLTAHVTKKSVAVHHRLNFA